MQRYCLKGVAQGDLKGLDSERTFKGTGPVKLNEAASGVLLNECLQIFRDTAH